MHNKDYIQNLYHMQDNEKYTGSSNSLTSDKNDPDDIQISPFVKSLSPSVKLPSDLDYKKAVGDYLEQKHKWRSYFLAPILFWIS